MHIGPLQPPQSLLQFGCAYTITSHYMAPIDLTPKKHISLGMASVRNILWPLYLVPTGALRDKIWPCPKTDDAACMRAFLNQETEMYSWLLLYFKGEMFGRKQHEPKFWVYDNLRFPGGFVDWQLLIRRWFTRTVDRKSLTGSATSNVV
jgi:hypothetical protein